MRSLMLSVAIAALVIGAVFVVTSSQADVKQSSKVRPSWEYKVVHVMELIDGTDDVDEITESLEKHLNALGKVRWEFCQEVNGGWVFKRER